MESKLLTVLLLLCAWACSSLAASCSAFDAGVVRVYKFQANVTNGRINSEDTVVQGLEATVFIQDVEDKGSHIIRRLTLKDVSIRVMEYDDWASALDEPEEESGPDIAGNQLLRPILFKHSTDCLVKKFWVEEGEELPSSAEVIFASILNLLNTNVGEEVVTGDEDLLGSHTSHFSQQRNSDGSSMVIKSFDKSDFNYLASSDTAVDHLDDVERVDVLHVVQLDAQGGVVSAYRDEAIVVVNKGSLRFSDQADEWDSAFEEAFKAEGEGKLNLIRMEPALQRRDQGLSATADAEPAHSKSLLESALKAHTTNNEQRSAQASLQAEKSLRRLESNTARSKRSDEQGAAAAAASEEGSKVLHDLVMALKRDKTSRTAELIDQRLVQLLDLQESEDLEKIFLLIRALGFASTAASQDVLVRRLLQPMASSQASPEILELAETTLFSLAFGNERTTQQQFYTAGLHTAPTSLTLETVNDIAHNTGLPLMVRKQAYLCLGSLLSNEHLDAQLADHYVSALRAELQSAAPDVEKQLLLLRALGNAGSRVSVAWIEPYAQDTNEALSSAARDILTDLHKLEGRSKRNTEVVGAALNYDPNLYPRRWHETIHATIGGSYVNGEFRAEAMVGANFGCGNPPSQLNYRVYGHVHAKVEAFNRDKTVFEAHVDYWKEGTRNGPQEAYLKVWEQLRWSTNLPTVCDQVGYNMRKVFDQELFGFNAGFSIHVIVISVGFNAGVSAHASLYWGHQLCDTTGAPAVGAKLSAFAAINVHAGVEASVYLAKGGIDVVVGLNAKYEPEARASARTCDICLLMTRIYTPMTAKVQGWYRTRKFGFFGGWNSKKTKTFWEWHKPAETTVIWQKCAGLGALTMGPPNAQITAY